MEIRELTLNEIEEAVKLKIDCWTEELAGKAENDLILSEELDFWQNWVETGEQDNDIRLMIGVFKDNIICGVAFSSLAETYDIDEDGIELNGLWIKPEYRGKGYSLHLLKYIIDFYKNFQKKEMVIYSHHYAPSNSYYHEIDASVLRQDLQSDGKLLIDVFIVNLDRLEEKIKKKFRIEV